MKLKFEEIEVGEYYIARSSKILSAVRCTSIKKQYYFTRIMAENPQGIKFEFDIDLKYIPIYLNPSECLLERKATKEEINLFKLAKIK